MVQEVSRRPVTAETRVRSQVSPCVICSGQVGTGAGFFSHSTSFFPVSILPRWAGHVARMGRRGVYRVLVGKPETNWNT
jgi:hypothetical protein